MDFRAGAQTHPGRGGTVRTRRCLEGIRLVVPLAILVAGLSADWLLASGVGAQEAKTVRPSGKDRRIIILGTTIVGSITKPRVVYQVPWREPVSLQKGLQEPQRSFQDEIFLFLDKEQFESEEEPSHPTD